MFWQIGGFLPSRPSTFYGLFTHIRYINSAYAKENCSGDLTHNIPNYQVGVLLTDCWRTERFCTFYEAHWHDWASCGDTTTESYHTIDLKTGNKLELSDLIKEEDYPALADIMMDYLKSYNGYYWRDLDHSSGHLWPITALGVLKEINGCALIREGLILYFYLPDEKTGIQACYSTSKDITTFNREGVDSTPAPVVLRATTCRKST